MLLVSYLFVLHRDENEDTTSAGDQAVFHVVDDSDEVGNISVKKVIIMFPCLLIVCVTA